MPMRLRDVGAGPAVVLIHGFPGNAEDFAALTLRLSPHHRVLVPDLLGFGQSPAPEGSLWLEAQAAALDEALRARGVTEAVLVGHDVGGPIAAWLATLWGKRALALVVASGALVGDPPVPLPFRLLKVPWLGALVEAVLFSGLALRVLGRFSTFGARPADNPPFEVESIKRIFATALRDMPGHYAALEAALAHLEVPATFVVGARDPFFKADFAARMARTLRGRLEVLDGVGHFPQLEAPEEVAAIIERARLGR